MWYLDMKIVYYACNSFQKSILLLTRSWRRPLSYRKQSIDLLHKSMDWFLYGNALRHERVNEIYLVSSNAKNMVSAFIFIAVSSWFLVNFWYHMAHNFFWSLTCLIFKFKDSMFANTSLIIMPETNTWKHW